MMIAGRILQGQNPYIRHLTVNDGLPSNNVYNVLQDSRKFIWFATDAGVVQFDGTNFKTYTTADGLPNNEVMRLEEDSQGRLWLFHLNGSFSFIHKDRLYTNRNAAYLDSLSNNMYFRRMYEDEKGSLYFYSNLNREIFVLKSDQSIIKYQLPSKNCYRIDKKKLVQEHLINKIRIDDGVFWLYLSGGIYTAKSLTDTLIPYTTAFHVDKSFEGNDKFFFLDVTDRETGVAKIIKLDGSDITENFHFIKHRINENITDVHEDRAGNTWIPSYFSGVYVYRNAVPVFYLNIEKPQNIIEDHQGNIWVATLGNGIYCLHPAILQHQHYDIKQFSGKGLKAVAKDNDSCLWISDGNYLYQFKNNRVIKLTYPFTAEGGLNKIGFLKNGMIIMHEPNQVLKLYQAKVSGNDALSFILRASTDKPVKQFAIAPDNECFTTFDPLNIFLYKNEILVSQLYTKNIDRYTAAFYGPGGQLFIAGKVIYKLSNDSLTPCPELALLNGKSIRGHLNLNREAHLFNIGGDSLWIFFKKAMHSVNEHLDQNLPAQIRSLCYDGESFLFIATNNHIYWISDFFNVVKGKKLKLNHLDIRFSNISQIIIHNQSLCVASDDGLSFIPLNVLTVHNDNVPLAYFREIIINDSILAFNQNQSSVRGKHTIRFSLGNIHFSALQTIYAYMLKGRDNSWTITTDRSIAYQDLRPGKYTFKFKTRLPNSDWSMEQQHLIHVKPTLLQHPVFFIALVSIIIAITVAIILRRKNILYREQESAHQMLLLEQKALQSMMNPHFIFNALGSIQSYILKNNTADAGLYLSQFARLIRQNLNAVKSSMIPLEEEVDRLRNYLELERMRMNNRFSFTIDIDREIEEDVLIPTMILQPIVENAILHGLSPLDSEDGVIHIYFKPFDEKCLEITVEDNGIGIERSFMQSGQKDAHLQIGMNLTLKRLELIGHRMKVKTRISTTMACPECSNPGTKVTIYIPYVF
jgi:signal transduction histidine kinase